MQDVSLFFTKFTIDKVYVNCHWKCTAACWRTFYIVLGRRYQKDSIWFIEISKYLVIKNWNLWNFLSFFKTSLRTCLAHSNMKKNSCSEILDTLLFCKNIFFLNYLHAGFFPFSYSSSLVWYNISMLTDIFVYIHWTILIDQTFVLKYSN